MTSLPRLTPLETPYKVDPYQRINPNDPPGFRRNWTMETTIGNWHNERRRVNMQRSFAHRQYKGWQSYYYGTPRELEDHKHTIRETLKSQMTEKFKTPRERIEAVSWETHMAREKDIQACEEDRDAWQKRRQLLVQYRDANKQIMEEKWQVLRQSRQREIEHERTLLAMSPVNWSGSLK